ncbi:MAG TPA: YkgJ family cysteine cluster protein [Desulfobacterales bacterium]|nr:YkgJ family cysteine cluster protein [Desulfobacterales bacterium]HIP39739.1 YkgJ family cysteine cluster protein [Desulfocapsa sulfexigens]
MDQVQLPKNVNRIQKDELFTFSCHPEVNCFTDCCRQLELALTPFDVLRLKQETKLDSSTFLERYVIQEQEAEDAFPRFYLTMVDDGQASCVFVAKTGCTVYPGRPGACRAYPMGRAAIRQGDNSMREFFVLLKESHCHGFQEKEEQTAGRYSEGQGLEAYNSFNDKVAILLQHEKIRRGMQLTEKQTQYFVLALYDLDNFRTQLNEGKLPNQEEYVNRKNLCTDDEELLLFGIEWLHGVLFNQ